MQCVAKDYSRTCQSCQVNDPVQDPLFPTRLLQTSPPQSDGHGLCPVMLERPEMQTWSLSTQVETIRSVALSSKQGCDVENVSSVVSPSPSPVWMTTVVYSLVSTSIVKTLIIEMSIITTHFVKCW